MNKLIFILGAMLLYMVAIFGLASFVIWDINPGNWSEGARFFTVLIGIMGLLPIVGLAGEID